MNRETVRSVSAPPETPRCATFRDLVLLEESGELGVVGAYRLRRHLAGCEACRAYREDLLRLRDLARVPEPAARPAEAALERVRSAARKASVRNVEVRWRPARWPDSWRPAFVYAALSVLVLFGFWLVLRPALAPRPATVAEVQPSATDWDDGLDAEIAEVRLLLAELAPADTSNGEEINAMAEELLILEGNI